VLIWLASYPRSGNSLLRQVLWYTMGLPTYHESARSEIPAEYGVSVTDEFGGVDQLRLAAADSEDAYLIKTHLPPGDDARAIYVVRDGRSAITSFLKYERTFSPESNPTLLRLILGDHYYLGWSDHYRAWHEREAGDTLTLRYEELFTADVALLQRIAAFVGFEGAIEPWQNPIAYWRERAPDLVGQGEVRWEPTEEWDSAADAAFWHVHGELMRELGYDDGRRLESFAPSVHELVEVAASAVAARRRSEATQTDMADLLDEVRHERELQTGAAADRLQAIEGLKREADELAAAAAERLRVIQTLKRETEELAAVAADRLRALEEGERERQRLAEELDARAALLRASESERELQTRVAAERLAALEELKKEHERAVAALEEQAVALRALEAERDLQAEVAAERLEALEALEQESIVRLKALEELSAQRFFSR
jgi:hypothetical protein